MIRRIIYVMILLAVAYSACKKEETSTVGNRPVVLAYLIPGEPVSIKVYQQKAFDDTSSYGALIPGLQITLSDGSQDILLQETSTGTYTYSDLLFLKTGKTYTMKFAYNNSQVSAITVMPARPTGYITSKTNIVVPEPENGPGGTDSVAATFRWNNPDSLYHVLVFENDNEVLLVLSGARPNAPANFSINVKQAAYYDIYYRSFNYRGAYNAILYTVNKDYSDILSSNANTSSQQLNNPPGNITNGYGIFTAMQADTIRLNISE